MDALLANEPAIRLAVFAGVLVLMARLEAVFPRRRRSFGRLWRWPNNLGVVVANTPLLRLDRMLTQPLRDGVRAYPLGRREPAS